MTVEYQVMSDSHSEQKKIYRTEAKRHRERIDQRSENIDHAIDNFFKALNPDKGTIVACYWPMRHEFDTAELLYRLKEADMICALPVIQKDKKELVFAKWEEAVEMEEGEFGTVHPKVESEAHYIEPDIIIVPLLAFDRKGHRLGYGGGYYDATLKSLRLKKNVVSVGWAYAQQAVLFNLPAEDHDEVLDYVITPKGVHAFKPTDEV